MNFKLKNIYLVLQNIFKDIIFGKKIKFLHIGKTGGSFIRDNLELIDRKKKVEFLLHPESFLKNDGYQYIFFVRDPINRFISAFWSRYRKGRPRYNMEWTEEEENTFKYFQTPNQLAEALYSDDKRLRQRSFTSIKSISHLRMDLSFYLRGIENIEECLDNIFYVGRLETINEDFKKIVIKLGYPKEDLINIKYNNIITHKTPNKYIKLSRISDIGRKNLTRYYQNDYKIIKFLHNKRMIN